MRGLKLGTVQYISSGDSLHRHNNQPQYLDSIIFLAASAYLASCFLASPGNFGFVNLTGMSFIISLYMDSDISVGQLLGRSGSFPLSFTFLSRSQRLKDSFGASIPVKYLFLSKYHHSVF